MKAVSFGDALIDELIAPVSKGYPEFNPDQPRDQLGRFGGGGGSGRQEVSRGLRTGSEARDLYAANVAKQPTPSVDAFIRSLPKSQQDFIAASERKLASPNLVATDAPVSKGGFRREDGTWTPERQRIHEKIIRNYIQDAIERATPGEGERPRLVMMGGRGGSGKTSTLESYGVIGDMDKFLVLNADDVKGMLPEYQGWNAAQLHEESSHIADQVERIARDLGLNIIYDATLKTEKSAVKRAEIFEQAGYSIEGYFVHTTPVTSATRAMGRAERSGRYVPPGIILASTTNEASFDAIKPKLDKWIIFDNNGKEPKKVASGGRNSKRRRKS